MAQSYEIIQDLLPIGLNRPGQYLFPIGITVHETATEDATDQNESKYFHNGDRQASAHYFADYDSITQLIPDNEVSWHGCYTANHKFISLEMCHFSDENKFNETWKRSVWLVALKCVEFGWNPENIEEVNTHNWVSETWGETDHTDPIGYFEEHNKTWNDFIYDVKILMEEISKVPEQWKLDIITNAKKAKLITSDHDPDEQATKWFVLATMLNLLKIIKG